MHDFHMDYFLTPSDGNCGLKFDYFRLSDEFCLSFLCIICSFCVFIGAYCKFCLLTKLRSVPMEVIEHNLSKLTACLAIGLIGITILGTTSVSTLRIFYYVSLTWSFTSSFDVLNDVVVLAENSGDVDELLLFWRDCEPIVLSSCIDILSDMHPDSFRFIWLSQILSSSFILKL